MLARSCVPVLALLAAAAPCRADAVDYALVRDAKAVMTAVRGLSGESVAVLKFAVQNGSQEPTFDAGLANVQLARKIETLLTVANDPKQPLLVLTGPTAKAKGLPAGATWRTADGRAAIAKMTGLSLAWDKTQNELEPDAFVTGVLKLGPDSPAAKLVLVGFTRKNPGELKELYTTPDADPQALRQRLPADRSVLALAGVSYAVDQFPADGNRHLVAQLGRELNVADTLSASKVKLEVLINGQPAKVRPDAMNLGAGRLEGAGPKAGDAVELHVRNDGNQTYGVVLAVNGRNTNSLGRDPYLTAKEAKDQRMWILAPGEKAVLKGFYTDEKGTYDEFKILGDAESEAAYPAMGEQFRGLITMHVFAKKPDPPAAGGTPPAQTPLKSTPEAEAAKKEEQAATVVTLGLGGSALEEVQASGSLEVARDRVQTLANVTRAGELDIRVDPGKAAAAAERGLIVESGVQRQGGPIEMVKFPFDPTPVSFVQLRYYGK
jgi:hypothetical protein